MASQQGKSMLAQLLGDRGRQAAEAHKNDEVNYGNMELPTGIEGGVAQLVEMKFGKVEQGKDNAGKPYFYAAGIVKAPAEVNGVPIVGLRTQVTEVICDTPTRAGRKTMDDHLAWVQNLMRTFGCSAEQVTLDNMEATAATLKKLKPHFRFGTFKGPKQELITKNGKFYVTGAIGGEKGPFATEAAAKVGFPYIGREPRVNHKWNGVCQWTDLPTATTEDDSPSADAPSSNGHVVEDDTPTEVMEQEVVTETEAVDSEAPQGDIDGAISALAEQANNGDEDAKSTLMKMAEAVGMSEDEIQALPEDWTIVAAAILEKQGGGETEEEQGGEDPVEEVEPPKPVKVTPKPTTPAAVKPAVGTVFHYKPKDKATGKLKAAIEVKVLAIDSAKKTVKAQSLENPKLVYPAIPIASLLA